MTVLSSLTHSHRYLDIKLLCNLWTCVLFRFTRFIVFRRLISPSCTWHLEMENRMSRAWYFHTLESVSLTICSRIQFCFTKSTSPPAPNIWSYPCYYSYENIWKSNLSSEFSICWVGKYYRKLKYQFFKIHICFISLVEYAVKPSLTTDQDFGLAQLQLFFSFVGLLNLNLDYLYDHGFSIIHTLVDWN